MQPKLLVVLASFRKQDGRSEVGDRRGGEHRVPRRKERGVQLPGAADLDNRALLCGIRKLISIYPHAKDNQSEGISAEHL